MRRGTGGTLKRLVQVGLWLAAVIVPALTIVHFPLSASRPAPGTPTLKIAAGSMIPLYTDMDSPLLAIAPTDALAMRISRDAEIALTDGQPDGRYRLGDSDWHSIKDGILTLHIDRIRPLIKDGKPEVRMHGNFVFHGEQR